MAEKWPEMVVNRSFMRDIRFETVFSTTDCYLSDQHILSPIMYPKIHRDCKIFNKNSKVEQVWYQTIYCMQ